MYGILQNSFLEFRIIFYNRKIFRTSYYRKITMHSKFALKILSRNKEAELKNENVINSLFLFYKFQ